MSELREKTVGPVLPPPQEASLEQLKQSLEAAYSNEATAFSSFLAERFAQAAPDAVTGRSQMPSAAYQMGRIIAKGGMGAILSARDNSIQRTVAVKVILTGAEASDEHVHRLITEARITGQLEHPNIVPLHELGVTADGLVYYTMRLVEGVTLSDVLEKIRQKDEAAIAKYPLSTLLTMFQKVCDAMAFAHSRGVVHRDLKPDNIMLGEFGEVFVMDWGLAKHLRSVGVGLGTTSFWKSNGIDELSGTGFKTLSGQVKGTPRYMAPEQAEGRVGDIDERTDIYALGAILYAILTLHPPVTGDTVNEVLRRVASGSITTPTSYNPGHPQLDRRSDPLAAQQDVTPPELAHCPGRRIPSALSAVAMQALARNQEERYQSVVALQEDLAAYQGDFATVAERASALRLLLLLVRRNRTVFALGFTSLALMFGLVAHFTRQVTRTLAELRQTAPTFYAEAGALVDQFNFAKALSTVNYAISLQPSDAKYYTLKGHILQSSLRLAEARDAYTRAVELDPETLGARRNRMLCIKLLADNAGQSTLKPESLAELRKDMADQKRTAEAIAMATRVSKGAPDTFASWKAVADRLDLVGGIKRETGGLSLTVRQPNFGDLTPFLTAPLTKLTLASTQVEDLSPLKGMLLQSLDINDTRVVDLTAIEGMPLSRFEAERTRATNFSVLTGMKLVSLNLAHTSLATLDSINVASLRYLQLEGCTNLTDISALAQCKQLEAITLPIGAKNLEALKQLPRLRRVGYTLPEGGWDMMPLAEDFWKAQEAGTLNAK